MFQREFSKLAIRLSGAAFLLMMSWILAAQPQGKWDRYYLHKTVNSGTMNCSQAFLVACTEAELRQILESSKSRVLRRLDDRTWVVIPGEIEAFQDAKRMLKPVNNLWKLADPIFDLNPSKKNDFLIDFISTDITVISEILADFPHEQLGAHLFHVRCTPEEVSNLADHEAVRFISSERWIPGVESRVIDMNLNPNRISTVHSLFPDLLGQGITVSVKEDRFTDADLDLIGRYKASGLASETTSLHATEMATIIAGAGNTFVTGKGVAPLALLTSSDFLTTLPDESEDYALLEAYVQNHSYGTTLESFYGIAAQRFDQSVTELPSLVHVFSSGNSGLTVSENGTYAGVEGYANLTGNFKMAKNVLVVGSVDTVGRSIDYASRGPAYDGRLRPEISAYSMVGSSNSAALVSGVVALLQQLHREAWDTYPSSALVRAILLAGSDDLDEPGPDFIRGFGSLNALNSVSILKARHYLTDSIGSGATRRYPLEVSEGIAQLTLALAWSDPAANPGDAVALVNDLDLVLTTESGDRVQPWILQTEVDALAHPSVRGSDHLNNVELISLEVPEPGSYVLEVSGGTLSTAFQSFSIAYRADTLGQFTWHYPVQGTNMPYNGETGTYFRWRSTLSVSEGRLEYRMEEGAQWQVIREDVPLKQGLLRWNTLPEKAYGLAEARMIVGSDTFLTRPFTLSPPMEVSVGFDCGDSLLLQWPKVKDAVRYDVYQPGAQYLELMQPTEDTALVLSATALSSDYFSIQPIRADDIAYLPTYTFEYTRQGAGCFLSSFYQEVVLHEGIYLHAQLGTTHGIDSLDFEVKRGDDYELLTRIEDVRTQLQVLDRFPQQGRNDHRVSIYFSNGAIVRQQAPGVYYLTDKASLLFPNPVLKSENVFLYTREFDTTPVMFTLHAGDGAQVLKAELSGTQEAIELTGISAGLYFYTIRAGKRVYTGKLVVE